MPTVSRRRVFGELHLNSIPDVDFGSAVILRVVDRKHRFFHFLFR